MAAFWFGPQWPLRVASLIFLAGIVVALRLPAKADSDPPEVLPKLFQIPWRHREENGRKVLSGPLVIAALVGVFLVQRRMSLVGDGMGHVALAGVAVGILTGTQPVLTALVAAVLAGVAI